VDATFSTYRPDSAISRLDRGELADVPGQVSWVLRRCEQLRRETDGFFDARALGGVLDPSALVKGWAVQCAADLLVAEGLRDFCLNAGGDVVTRGVPEPDRRWRVGIQHPRDRDALAAVVEATDLAVATSGTYERGEHIIDPHTGRPPSGVLSVTVCGPDLGTADAYSTAAFAMGDRGPAWTLGLYGYEALTILSDDTVLSTPGFPAASEAVSR
jgi:thiamine biosynthesis lipoprotein